MKIKEYWNLICREPVLAIAWESDFSQPCSFHRMLKDHENLRFTPITDKANDLIFLRSPKNFLFFCPFLASFFLPKKSCSVTKYGPYGLLWPSGLRSCSNNRKVPGSNPTRRSAGFRDPTSLRGSRWPTGRKCKTQWLTSGEWGCPLGNGSKLAVG